MVVKMMKWRPWPPLSSSKKFEAKIRVHQLQVSPGHLDDYSSRLFLVGIEWKGSKGINALSSLRRKRSGKRRNITKQEFLREDGVVQWKMEEFQSVCSLSSDKESSVFHPWELLFTVFTTGIKQGQDKNVTIFGNGSLNLADLANSAAENECREINISVALSGGNLNGNASLQLSVILEELRNGEEHAEPKPKPILHFPRSPCYGEVSTEKEVISDRKKNRRKKNIFQGLAALRAQMTGNDAGEDTGDGRSSFRIEDNQTNYPLNTDSVDAEDSEDTEEDSAGKSFNYGTLAYANHAGASIYSSTSSSDDEDRIYRSYHKSDVGPMHTNASVAEPAQHNSKRRLLSWRKRKIGFRSPKVKGEPLLKKYYGDDGGDDIDFDRRLISSSDESTNFEQQATEMNPAAAQPSASLFGDDIFAVGNWEEKEIVSRDGHSKLKTQVFFASIEQRSESAAGESACTALVAAIAHWLLSNGDEMPIKSQFDTLIREGSLEWRNLCENEAYGERYPDKHFDLDTVLEAEIRPIYVVPEKSFIGFFHPEGLLEDRDFDFLHGAMSFDDIWDEICQCGGETPSSADYPLVYIISWNDHFFVLKIEEDAYYIIDTLGERLYEGCTQAFILKFDKDSKIHRIAGETKKSDNNDKVKQEKGANGNDSFVTEDKVKGEEPQIMCLGKESCKEYIKSFLAAIPIRELQADLRRGLITSTPLHHQLQIEFHYIRCLNPIDGDHSDSKLEVMEDTDINVTLPLQAPKPNQQ